MGLQFHPNVAAQHRRLDDDAYENIYVIGDVHGCRGALDRLLALLDPTERDAVVFVGDLVRKGPDSAGVVRLVRGTSNFYSVRGNNEEKLLRGEKTVSTLNDDDLAWIESLPVAISWPGALVVHGGIDPRKPLSAHTVDDLQNVRSLTSEGGYERPFWYERHEGEPRVFFGHTVLERPVVREGAVGLDTGCVYGGPLTAYDVGSEATVQLPRAGELNRSDSKIITPAD